MAPGELIMERQTELKDILSVTINSIALQYKLTKREAEIINVLVLHGYSNKMLAQYFFITEKTVKNHIANIMSKINITSIRELFSVLFRSFIL